MDVLRSSSENEDRQNSENLLVSDGDASKEQLISEINTLRREVAELRRTRAEARRQAEESFNQLVAGVADYAIYMLDPEGRIATWNKGAETSTGYRAEEIIGQSFCRFFPRDAAAQDLPAKELEAGEANGRWEGEGWVFRKDGSRFWAHVAVTALRDETRRLRGFLQISRDLTERMRAEESLRAAYAQMEEQVQQQTAELRRVVEEFARSNTDLEQFAYVASHDLQEPLRAVTGCVQVLRRRYHGQLDDRADELITHTVEGVSRMQALINDLLAYSRVATRGNTFEPTDLNAVFDQAITDLQTAITEAGASVSRNVLPTVNADAGQLVQVFQNLISNAVKFRRQEGPVIHVAAERTEGHWRIAVKDDGIGITPEFFDRIFIIFQKLHVRSEYPGTGIGLAICKKVVERHGGRIWVESEPGRGSTFFFTIPDHAGAIR